MAKPVARYTYHDAEGRKSYRVTRWEPKRFTQEHWNGSGRWRAGRNGTPDLLYRLPEVINAVERGGTILITEGERDADAATDAGVVATTNSGGAGKWTDDLSRYLLGASVMIIWDRDEAGHRHARQVAASLKRAGVRRVRFARARKGNDLSDHLAAGLGLEQLVRRAPPEPEPEPEPNSEDRPRSAMYQLIELKLREHAREHALDPPQLRADGTGFEACCPAHDDRKPSLGVRVGEERDVVLYCQRGCEPEAVVAALGIDWAEFAAAGAEPADDFERDVEREARKIEVRDEAKRRVAAKHAVSRFALPEPGRTLPDDLAEPPAKEAFAIADLHPAGANSLLVAQYKAGKTTLALNLVKALADGVPFLGHFNVEPVSGRIAVLNYEMSENQFRDWADDIEVEHPERVAQPFHLRGHRLPFWEPDFMERLAAWLRAEEVEWLIVDPAARAWAGFVDNENDNAQMAEFTDALDDLKRQGSVDNLLLTTHTGRAKREEGEEQSRGATRLEDWADSLWYLTKDGGPDSPRALRAMGRDVEVDAIDLEYLSGDRTLRATGATRSERRQLDGIQRAVDALGILKQVGDDYPPTTGALEKAMEGDKNRRNGWIVAAEQAGYIERHKGEGQSKLCHLTEKGHELHARRAIRVSEVSE